MGKEGLMVSHLQYPGDTLVVRESTFENIWSLNTIL